jgi:hypothetical protein
MASDYRNNFHLCMDCLQALVLKPYLSPDARALALESKAAGKPPRSCSIRPRLLSAAGPPDRWLPGRPGRSAIGSTQ